MDAATNHVRISAVPRRRNGRQQACEPCRKRKVSCDHSLPGCQRCKRRNERCYYQLGPTPAGRPGLSGVRGSPSSSGLSSSDATARSSHTVASTPPSPSLSTASITTPGRLSPPRKVPDSPGYLGPTSFSAVFSEARDHLSHPHQPQPSSDGTTPLQTTVLGESAAAAAAADTLGTHHLAMSNSSRIEQGIQILRAIPPPATGMALYEKTQRPTDAWMQPAIEQIVRSVWQSFGDCLSSPEGLRRMAETLCANSAAPLDEDQHDPQLWLASFSGRNLRWESVGIAFSCFAVGAIEANFREAMVTYKECATRCAVLCKEQGQANSLLLFLSYRNSIIESMVSGDMSLQCSSLTAETVSIMTYLGMHVEPPSDVAHRKIYASAESRRRLFWAVFAIDKSLSICSGRPPMLNRRYITTQMPLDISNEALLSSSKEPLERAISALDAEGWNTAGGPIRAKALRAWAQLSLVRDEILELALKPSEIRHNLEQLKSLRTRQQRETAALPEVLQYNPSDLKEGILESVDLYGKIILRLGHLQSIFFLERLLIKAGDSGSSNNMSAALVEVSVDIVALTNALWTHRDRTPDQHRDFEWIVISFAAPAGGVLCMELLKPHQQHQSSANRNPNLARSNIVQQLSLLVGFLDWIGPSAPNARLSVVVKEAIQHVLNQVLNGSVPSSQSTAPIDHGLNSISATNGVTSTSFDQQQQPPMLQPQGSNQFAFQDFDFTTDLTELFNFDLLDTFDFLRPEAA